jgi:hypothetical protein
MPAARGVRIVIATSIPRPACPTRRRRPSRRAPAATVSSLGFAIRPMHRQLNRSTKRALRRSLAVWTLASLGALCTGMGLVPPARAQSAVPGVALERRVKAAFLYKFLGYTDFPASAFVDAAAPLTIGVIGADDLAVELARVVAGRTVNNRPVEVRELREADAPARMHLLFVGGLDPQRVARIVRQASGAMLIVTECDSGLQLGSVINFRIVDERVRFDVSLDAAERNGIKLSSRLLTVANRVQKGAQ